MFICLCRKKSDCLSLIVLHGELFKVFLETCHGFVWYKAKIMIEASGYTHVRLYPICCTSNSI